MKRPFPRVLNRIGIPFVLCTWLLAAELIWEQTALSWARGPQMVGFSLVHSSLALLLLVLIPGGMLWALAMVVAAALTRSLSRTAIILVVAYASALGALAIPYGFWQRQFVSRFRPSHACAFTVSAAANGDVATVATFLKHGTSVNCMDRDGTALHAAAYRGQLTMIEYLIANGANVNALNPYGDSVLASAANAETNKAEAEALLAKHGAILVRGTKEQRDRVISEQVKHDIDEMNKSLPPR